MADRAPETALFTETRKAVVSASPAQAFAPIKRIGGAEGWYFANSLWRIRQVVDRVLGRPVTWGRRDPDECRVGDSIDGWRVERYEVDRRLRLQAEIWLPGRGWLEFEVLPRHDGRVEIRQLATFEPAGLAGRLYWMALLPIHRMIFSGMIRAIAARAEGRNGGPPAGRSGAASGRVH